VIAGCGGNFKLFSRVSRVVLLGILAIIFSRLDITLAGSE